MRRAAPSAGANRAQSTSSPRTHSRSTRGRSPAASQRCSIGASSASPASSPSVPRCSLAVAANTRASSPLPASQARSAAASSAGVPAMTASRQSIASRPTCRVQARSGSSSPSLAGRCAAGAGAGSRCRSSAATAPMESRQRKAPGSSTSPNACSQACRKAWRCTSCTPMASNGSSRSRSFGSTPSAPASRARTVSSSGSGSAAGTSSGCSSSASSLCAEIRSASAVRADSRMGQSRCCGAGACGCGCGNDAVGHSSTTTCALAPPAPKEETPAMRGCGCPSGPTGCHGASACCSTNGVSSKRRLGLGSAACSVGASCRWRICSTSLVSPAMPAAASRWPMPDFTEPSAQRPGAAAAPKACTRPANSTGSPSSVPVPCASMQVTALAGRPARCSAARTTSRCASGLGTV